MQKETIKASRAKLQSVVKKTKAYIPKLNHTTQMIQIVEQKGGPSMNIKRGSLC